jgi:hypothetical protein
LGFQQLLPDWQNFCNLGTFKFTTTAKGGVNQIVTITYQTQLTGAPKQMNCVSLNSFTFALRPTIFFFLLETMTGTRTVFKIQIQTNYGSDISNLLMGWLCVDPSFPNPFSIGYIDVPKSLPRV